MSAKERIGENPPPKRVTLEEAREIQKKLRNRLRTTRELNKRLEK